MRSFAFVALLGSTLLLSQTGCSSCGDTTLSTSSITGTVTLDGVAVARTDELVSAFDSGLDVSWHDGRGETLVDFTLALRRRGGQRENCFSRRLEAHLPRRSCRLRACTTRRSTR